MNTNLPTVEAHMYYSGRVSTWPNGVYRSELSPDCCIAVVGGMGVIFSMDSKNPSPMAPVEEPHDRYTRIPGFSGVVETVVFEKEKDEDANDAG